MKFYPKTLVSFATLLFICTTLFAQTDATEAYILTYKNIAIRQMNEYGIPASIILAQGSLESGNGKSRLAVKAHNHFGIKCHGWKGATIYHDDDKKNECFRKYNSPNESYKDHSEFIRYRERYRFLFNLDIKDYKGWAHGLKAAGYATNPNYATLLIKIIEKYSLFKYDNLSQGLPTTPDRITQFNKLLPEKSSNLYSISLSRPLYTKNGVACIRANKNDTYSSIAKEFGLFRRELLRFNDLSKNRDLTENTIVYIERKKAKGNRELPKHIAEKGETMHNISQKYGIRLKKLLKLNSMNKKSTISQGDIIKLR